MEIEQYKTINEYAESELKIKGSRFIGQLYPVKNPEDAGKILARCRKEYHNATHRCYAYRTGIEEITSRYSDDGEPPGTAGKPILNILEHNEITNVLMIVVRYFGGTKLGTGGLVRAYTETVQSVLRTASVVLIPVLNNVRITFPYDRTSGVMRVIAQHGLKINDTEFGEDVVIHIGIKASIIETVRDQLSDITAGNIAFKM